jgi:hypothetical protein
MATRKKPMFSRSGQTFGSFNKENQTAADIGRQIKTNQFDPNNLTVDQVANLLIQNPEIRRSKNLYLAEELNESDIDALIDQHVNNLNERVFTLFKPQWKMNRKDAIALSLGKTDADKINSILQATDTAYRMKVMDDKITDCSFTLDKHIKLMAFYAYSRFLLNKNQLQVLYDLDVADRKKIIKDQIDFGDDRMAEAIKQFMKDGKIISVLKEAEEVYADVAKVADRYSIRMGDGKYFVASDDVQIAFRDPSDNPAWATWFLTAVPMNDIPDRAKLSLLPPEERKKHYPKVIPDRPIICHASLWQLGQASGVLLHTSWNHISVSYRWKIDKPIEISSILFKAVAHPAHIARNFGYAPQMRVPGEDWF